jgi:Flp pilus assembly protein TadG
MSINILRALWAQRQGSVSLISAIALPLLIAMVGLVAEYGNGLLHKVEDQRIADAAAFAAATSYNANPANSLTSVVASVATLNGIPASAISATLTTSPSGDGNQAVLVNVSTQAPLLLSQVLGNSQANLTVTASSYAEMKGGSPGCIIALSASGTGVTLTGGTSVTASACAVASDNAVSVPCGTSITTVAVNYNSAAAPSEPCTGIQAPSGKTLQIKKSVTADPLAGNSEVAAATARLTSGTFYTGPGSATAASTAGVAGLTAPAAPAAAGGSAVTPGYAAIGVSGLPSGCVDYNYTPYSPIHNVQCTGNGPFNFGAVSIGGGITFNVTTVSATAPVFNIASINMSGTAMSWPAGKYNIPGGIYTSGGNTSTFGAGAYNIGAGSFSCNGSSGYSICNTATSLIFGGPSTFVTQGGIYNNGGDTLTLGAGTSNSFDIGKANDGNAFVAGGGANTTFADATGGGDVFEMAGNVNVSSGGGSCLTLSAATQHDIDGYFSSAGGTALGAGIYTIEGYFALGANGGGDVSCNGASIGLTGTNVTLVLGGATTPSSGTCQGQAFCMAAGYSNVALIAPTAGATANLAVVGPLSGAEGATLAEGASGANFSGAFYFPTAPIRLSGGSSLGSFGSSQCLMLIGAQVTLTGGSALASACSGLGGSTGSGVVLVQ